MAERLILETTFLVDLEREHRSSPGRGSATDFLHRHEGAALSITWTTVGELAAVLTVRDRDRWVELVRRFEVLPIDQEACWLYGQTYRYLREHGLLIGTNDLWIAAAALRHGLPLVTRNPRHFRRVAGLEVVEYAGVA